MEIKIKNWICDKKELIKSYEFYLSKEIVQKVDIRENLYLSHFEKSEHNLDFSYFLIKENKYLDWSVVGLYYAVYHSSLSLLLKIGFKSKNHQATLCFLIFHFSEFGKEEIQLYEDLLLKEEEIFFYSSIKNNREKASYTTNINFTREDLEILRERTLLFINKVENLLN